MENVWKKGQAKVRAWWGFGSHYCALGNRFGFFFCIIENQLPFFSWEGVFLSWTFVFLLSHCWGICKPSQPALMFYSPKENKAVANRSGLMNTGNARKLEDLIVSATNRHLSLSHVICKMGLIEDFLLEVGWWGIKRWRGYIIPKINSNWILTIILWLWLQPKLFCSSRQKCLVSFTFLLVPPAPWWSSNNTPGCLPAICALLPLRGSAKRPV